MFKKILQMKPENCDWQTDYMEESIEDILQDNNYYFKQIFENIKRIIKIIKQNI